MSDILNSYYPSQGSKTYYALYAPSIERFLLVEKYNPLVFLQTGYVLSSKLSGVIFFLPEKEKHPTMTNDSCLLFSLSHAKYNPEANVNGIRPIPTVSMLKHNKIIKLGEPKDYSIGERKEILIKLQSYASFCQSCLHAINLAAMLHQHTWTQIKNEQYYYNNVFFEAGDEDERIKKNDVEQMMNILFFADNREQALEDIKNFWLKKINLDIKDKIFWPEKIKRDILSYIDLFYNILAIDIPQDLKNILK
jgi:hypothetical protein